MPITRREFVARSAATAAALGVARYAAAAAANTADIRVATIGIRGQGETHMRTLHKNLVAICDVDEQVLATRAKQFADEFGKKLDTFVDFRDLLERDDIDAVSIAAPNHQHALITIEAAQAGKDVYCEKPASHNIWEGRQMVRAARKYGRIIQCGTQSRSMPSARRAQKYVAAGHLGKVLYVQGMCYKPRQSIGRLDQPLQIPSHVHYDLWCGPAEKRDLYRGQLHYDWHWDHNTGNGDTGNQGIHQMDVCRWFLGVDTAAPRVISIGGRLGYDDAGDTPNTQVTYHDYPDAPLIFETRGLPRSKKGQGQWGESMDRFRECQVGVIVQCERGHVRIDAFREPVIYDRSGHVVEDWKEGANLAGQTDVDHFTNWLGAVAARDPSRLHAEILEGHLSTTLCLTSEISHRVGTPLPASEIAERIAGNDLLSAALDRMTSHLRANHVDVDDGPGLLTMGAELEFDVTGEDFNGHGEANELLTRNYRAQFVVPDLA